MLYGYEKRNFFKLFLILLGVAVVFYKMTSPILNYKLIGFISPAIILGIILLWFGVRNKNQEYYTNLVYFNHFKYKYALFLIAVMLIFNEPLNGVLNYQFFSYPILTIAVFMGAVLLSGAYAVHNNIW